MSDQRNSTISIALANRHAMPMIEKTGKALLWLLIAALAVLYLYVAYHSFGFDDEFSNYAVVESRTLLETIRLTQGHDVHPPLSYALNSVLFSVLKDWRLVRMASGALNVAAIACFVFWLLEQRGFAAALIGYITLGLSPALLMWTTSLRWYAYFVPLTIVLLTLPQALKRRPARYWPVLGVGLVILGYTGYAILCIAPALIAWYWTNRDREDMNQRRLALRAGALALLAYLPQIPVFIGTLAYADLDAQSGSLFARFAGIFISVFSNQGLFPTSPFAWVGALGWALLFGLVAVEARRSPGGRHACLPLVLSTVLLVAAGVAAKFRNLLLIVPFQALSAASVSGSRHRRVLLAATTLVLIANIAGVVNVTMHRGTTKNSWNLPIDELFARLDGDAVACGGHLVLVTHDAVIAHFAQRRAARFDAVVFYDAPGEPPLAAIPEPARCVAVVKTFRGAIAKATYSRLLAALGELGFERKDTSFIGPDPDAAFKRRFIDDAPDNMVELQLLTQVTNLKALQPWLEAGQAWKIQSVPVP